jgi:hypothetical protein
MSLPAERNKPSRFKAGLRYSFFTGFEVERCRAFSCFSGSWFFMVVDYLSVLRFRTEIPCGHYWL